MVNAGDDAISFRWLFTRLDGLRWAVTPGFATSGSRPARQMEEIRWRRRASRQLYASRLTGRAQWPPREAHAVNGGGPSRLVAQ